MNLRQASLAFLAGFGILAPVEAREKAARPNFIFLLADDLGFGDLGCFGNTTIKTPHLDRLASRGIKLTSFYSPAPVCSPSRAGFLTGRVPTRLGIHDWIPANSGIYLARSEISVASLFRKAGYRTAHAGKWHLNSRMDGSEPTPGDHGFEHWFSTQNNAAPSHENPTNFVRDGKPVGPLKGNSSTLLVDEALRFLQEKDDRPFLLFVWFHAPHEPIAAPAKFAAIYQGLPEPTRREYSGCVTLMDEEIGRLLAFLDAWKLADNTVVFFTSDNGPETLRRYRGAERSHGSAGPLRGMKLHLYEGGYREPAMIVWPGKVRPGQTSDEALAGVDLLPTFCDLAGIGLPRDRDLDGISWRPLLEGQSLRRDKPLYWQYDKALSQPWKVALRDGPWKLLADGAREKFALYNLAEDLREQKDLAAAQPGRVRQLADVLNRKHQDVNRRAVVPPSENKPRP